MGKNKRKETRDILNKDREPEGGERASVEKPSQGEAPVEAAARGETARVGAAQGEAAQGKAAQGEMPGDSSFDGKRFNAFEKLDRRVEKTIHSMETMDKRRFYKNSFVYSAIIAVVLNLFIEVLGRLSTEGSAGGFKFMAEHPVVFLFNAMIIYATLVLGSLFRRRLFFFMMVSAVWMALGVTNGIILSQRMTPFTVKDFANAKDGITITVYYLTRWQIAGIIIGAILLIALLILLFLKCPKKKNLKRKRNLAVVAAVLLLTTIGYNFAIKIGLVDTFFGNLAYAYRDNGVVYGFTNTWLNTGIKKPSDYSKESILKIFSKDELGPNGVMEPVIEDVQGKFPNILFLQLESFIDPLTFTHVKFDGDPCPNFRRLRQQYSSGTLTVPACGAGTSNVEFEMLTGLSIKFFGPGEYPYKSVLTENTVENLANDLAGLGYSSHAVHNHRAAFYNRNKVFANMGFDTFTSVEYMHEVQKTPNNWAKDNVLEDCILDALNSTPGRDLIYTISVQGHGKYPREESIKNPKIRVTSAPSEEEKWSYEYYANQVFEMDKFVGDLIAGLEAQGEPFVLAVYGDHVPALDLVDSQVESGDLYHTQYLIWNNIGLEKKDENLYSYQMTAKIMESIGMNVGTIFKYQLNHRNSESYLKDLQALGYDMLYGKKYVYGEKNPFKPSKMEMGVNEIKIEKLVQIGGSYYIKGVNFNTYSKITLDGKQLETVYLSSTLLALKEEIAPEDVERMKVSQVEKSSKEILSTTE